MRIFRSKQNIVVLHFEDVIYYNDKFYVVQPDAIIEIPTKENK